MSAYCAPLVIVNGQPPVQIVVSGTGPVGPIGGIGPAGPAGPAGPGGGSYFHTQMLASNTWTIVHNLGYRPSYVAIDQTNDEIPGIPSYPDVNTLVITFSVSVSGTAALS